MTDRDLVDALVRVDELISDARKWSTNECGGEVAAHVLQGVNEILKAMGAETKAKKESPDFEEREWYVVADHLSYKEQIFQAVQVCHRTRRVWPVPVICKAGYSFSMGSSLSKHCRRATAEEKFRTGAKVQYEHGVMETSTTWRLDRDAYMNGVSYIFMRPHPGSSGMSIPTHKCTLLEAAPPE